jgi:hypothetical protein
MKEAKLLAASWSRSFLAAALAVYLAGVHDPKAIAAGGLTALLPVAIRWLNPKDTAFGLEVKK